MTTHLYITERRTGKLWDAATITENATYETNRTGSPGKFQFTLWKAGDISFVEGDQVRFEVDGQIVFYGWVFHKEKNRWGKIDVTCYDRLRYLKANASYGFYGMTAGQIIQQIAEDFELEIGTIEDTGYQIPSLICEDQSCLDIINNAVQQTLLNTGEVFVFYDNGNGLCLQNCKNMISNTVLGDRSLVTDYTYTTDIDKQTYNSVKLVLPNEETGKMDVYQADSSYNIDRWGLLRLYQKIDGDVNPAQAMEQAKTMLKYYNRRMRTLSVESIGVLGLRAGMMMYLKIFGLGDINLSQYVLLERVTHKFQNDLHTMDFETYDINEEGWGENVNTL